MKYLCGGYVSYDTRKKDPDWDFPIRRTIEVEVIVELGKNSPDDCGYGTETVFRALEEKVKKRFKVDRNVECTECWECPPRKRPKSRRKK